MAEKEYIEREKLNDMLEDFCVNESFYDVLQTIPAADVAPVRHGYWIPQFVSKRGLSNHFVCSECAKSTFTPRKFEMIKYAYCPYCGAKMDGDPYA